MVKIKTSSIKCGMKLSKSIFSAEGNLLIEKGAQLKENIIQRLDNHNVDSIFIEWDTDGPAEVIDAVLEDTKDQAVTLLRQSMENIETTKNINVDKLKDIVNNLIDGLVDDKSVLVNLTNIRSVDDHTFSHSVNVCILSLLMGVALKYDLKSLETLGIGALLHDIGKADIDDEILNKPGAFTVEEYDLMKKHAMLGYEMVKDIEGISEESRMIIRDHHERFDGKGYPKGLIGTKIHEFARIVAICDVYDALTSNRVYRQGMPLHIGLEYLRSMGNHQFDYRLVKVFMEHVSIYPQGTIVELESGERGIVIECNKNWPTRPVVEVLYDDKGNKIDKSKVIDLTKFLNNGITVKLGMV
ncbi:HD-GYP domain-containing protein [Serpentinicella sp. ANB-PHB4]|uniref:HD-GYP domain-containing protein n=1 Tax=Serpentinicella sp. ANB-PHB4 TaxID=3074076 RepID=UPI00285D47EC|nr:HD-GYP domain-containing protein [Serpentinicella sp. ANB-PHB4]MDR5659379.1 HD-GYP domain-containing protein [Serpentinicella sp. ANB-PHB4]